MINEIGVRVGEVIKALGMKKVRFAEQIGVDQSYMTKLSKGAGQPSDLLITSICREFNVDETWLRTGEGEMFVKKEPLPLDKLLAELLDGTTVTNEDKALVKNFLELSDNSRKEVIEFVQKCAAELSAQVQPATAGQARAVVDSSGQAMPDIAAELAELKRQNQELAAKVAAMEEEDTAMEAADEFSPWGLSGGTKTG